MQPIHWRKKRSGKQKRHKISIFFEIEFAIDKKNALLLTIFYFPDTGFVGGSNRSNFSPKSCTKQNITRKARSIDVRNLFVYLFMFSIMHAG